MGGELVEQTLLRIAGTNHRPVGTTPQCGLYRSQVEASTLHRAAVTNQAVSVEEREYLNLEGGVDKLQLGLVSHSYFKGLRSGQAEVHKQIEPTHHAHDQSV